MIFVGICGKILLVTMFFGVTFVLGFKNRLLSIPFPDTCIVCGKPVRNKEYACFDCQRKIPYISDVFKCRTCLSFLSISESGICGDCLIKKPDYSRLISCVEYEGYIKKTLRAFKFYNRPDYHIGYSKLACEVLQRSGTYFDGVVPIPLSKKSLKSRGYNQSLLISRRIAEYFDVPCFEDLLIKTKETKKQSQLNLEQRKRNIKGAFSVYKPERLNDLHILLVDDIFTSGCTMREASRVLCKHTEDITAFTIARAKLKY